jgi:hypothetical protein
VDYAAIKELVTAWLAALADSDPAFHWVLDAAIETYPAYLVPVRDEDGDRARLQSTAALPIQLQGSPQPDAASVQQLQDWIVRDPTLGGRVAHTIFERASSDESTICVLVVTPAGA